MESLVGLLERDAELGEIRRLLDEADHGRGSLLLIEGPPGIGKTSLLAAARTVAAEAGVEVLATRAGELERELAWGVVRGLVEPALHGLEGADSEALLDGAARLALAVLGEGGTPSPAGAGDALASSLHGLYWLTANLAIRRPLLIAVDDVQWADASSCRWLAYMATRLGELPLVLLLTARPLELDPQAEPLRLLKRESTLLRLAPLTPVASAELVRGALGELAEERFCLACHDATGGNPFLLSQLLDELQRQEVLPLDLNAHRVESIGARAMSDAVGDRLGRLSHSARELACAVAVLGSEAKLSDATALAGLDADVAAGAAKALTEAGLLADAVPLRFVHPLLRTALYEGLPAVDRARSHARAAALLAGPDVPAHRLAPHLVSVEPAGDPQVARRLAEAAELALEQGAPDATIAYLRRALAEPPPQAERPALLHLLGQAEVAVTGPGGLATMEAALAACLDPGEGARVALDLSRSVRMWGGFRRAAEALEEALERLDPESELFARVEGELIGVAACDAASVQLAARRLSRYAEPDAAERVHDPGLLADLAVASAAACRPRGVTSSFAHGALAALPAGAWDPSVLVFATTALACAGELEEARAAWDAAIEPIRASGSTMALGFALAWRAMVVLRIGDVREAEADTRTAAAIYRPWGNPISKWFLAEALTERGELREAEQLLRPEEAPERGEVLSPGAFDWIPILHARGRLRLAAGDPDAALADFLEAGRKAAALGYLAPGLFPWRSGAAIALLQLGDSDCARELAAEELQLARAAGAPHAIGTALCTCGPLERGQAGLALLEEAVEVLAGSPAALSHARALCELGARLRRDGRRSQAKRPLQQALDLADRCGATMLATRAREELVAAGARPRRARTSGPEALTASELRVARMAAEGKTNTEIAQALFITLSTVETHLRHAYQKLDIRSRRELPDALGQDPSGPA